MKNTSLMISFVFSYIFIILNIYNMDESITLDSSDSSVWKYFSLDLSSANTDDYGPKMRIFFKVAVPLVILSGVLLLMGQGKHPNTNMGITGITFLIAFILFIYSTYLFTGNINNTSCYLSQLSLKGSENDSSDTVYINTTTGYKLIYAVGLIALIFSLMFTKSITGVLSILVYFGIGILFQLFGTGLLFIFNTDKNTWPSVFSYLDQFIQNTDTDNTDKENNDLISAKTIFKIIGSVRLFVLVLLSGYISYSTVSGHKTIDLLSIGSYEIIKLISIGWSALFVLILIWQIIIGDGCIINRTMERDKKNNNYNSMVEFLLQSLKCSVQNQLGIYFHMIIVAFIVGWISLH